MSAREREYLDRQLFAMQWHQKSSDTQLPSQGNNRIDIESESESEWSSVSPPSITADVNSAAPERAVNVTETRSKAHHPRPPDIDLSAIPSFEGKYPLPVVVRRVDRSLFQLEWRETHPDEPRHLMPHSEADLRDKIKRGVVKDETHIEKGESLFEFVKRSLRRFLFLPKWKNKALENEFRKHLIAYYRYVLF